MQLTANDMRYIITEAAQRLLEGVEWSRGYGRGGGLPGKSRTMNMHINFHNIFSHFIFIRESREI